LKTTKDIYGKANEHYIVKCLVKCADVSIPTNNLLGKKKQIYLVNVSDFNNWIKDKSNIICI
jgi:hypothetical protein